MGGRGASGPVSSEHGLSREIRKHNVPRHVRAGAVDKFLSLGFVDGKRLASVCTRYEALRRKVANVVEAQQGLHKVVDEQVKRNHDRQRQAASRGKLPNFAMGDYVMVKRVRRPDSTPKFVSTWTGPWQIVTAKKVHVYGVQNDVIGEVKDVHVVRLRFYVDKNLEMMVALKEVFQHALHRVSLR